ncbi:DUF397 domain-containing protein [Planomonospora sp. ID67723]|uniref:DUF397 domain-containing protein n=1 Tax=Planomonospora sp. ID67723 TaxID=2738134 RepID=UPI0018C3EEA0|nr:DUF397 domain-containing protein [Planomonospora sp. ID67723]MBG0827362.1 DUF397 domain-containing protein [Planomonospora sp. ID67723]
MYSPDDVSWVKSSLSSTNNECVEVARSTGGPVFVRDSKDPAGPVLAFAPGEWRAFLAGVRNAEFDV